MPVAVPFPKIELHVRLEGTVRPPALPEKRSSASAQRSASARFCGHDDRASHGARSLSAAMDGGFTAIADVTRAMNEAHAADDYRLIGGVTA